MILVFLKMQTLLCYWAVGINNSAHGTQPESVCLLTDLLCQRESTNHAHYILYCDAFTYVSLVSMRVEEAGEHNIFV